MQEPLFWNPLTDAAVWLSQKTGRTIDARGLLDIVIGRGVPGDGKLTIVKAILPRNMQMARLAVSSHPQFKELIESPVLRITRRAVEPLPDGWAFVSYEWLTAAPLSTNCLIDLLIHGHVEIMHVAEPEPKHAETVWLMPWGTSHTATLETCGINRADLMALGDALTEPAKAPNDDASDTPRVDPWIELAKEHATNIWLKEFETHGRDAGKKELARIIAGRFRGKFLTKSGQEITPGYVYDAALKGNRWKKPQIGE